MTARASPGAGVMAQRQPLAANARIPIWIELEALNKSVVERFERSLRHHSAIEECYAVAGNTDYLLFVSVNEIEEFERIHRNILSKLPGVKKIRAEFLLWRVLPA
jgi:DNA-binding Lrp family transcriptional regulator